MNCDQAFDALTRGPFPTGNDALDERVERHLERCSSCRRLAAALQPAVELFEEAVSPEESCRLPAYWGELFHQGNSRPTTRTRTRRAPSRSQALVAGITQKTWRWEHAWRIAAALLLGMTLGGLMRAALREEPETVIAFAPSESGDRESPTQRSRRVRAAALDSLQMTDACGPLSLLVPEAAAKSDSVSSKTLSSLTIPPENGLPDDSSPAGLEASLPSWNGVFKQKCCTECHHAGGQGSLTQHARAQVASSCALCHDNSAAQHFSLPQGGE